LATFKFVMFFVWLAAMVLACWAWEVGRMFSRRMQKEAGRRNADVPSVSGDGGSPAASHLPGAEESPDPAHWPAAAVILPIKGLDEDTEDNVRALLRQDYPLYRLLFAVESAGDPVVPLLARISEETAKNPAGPSIEVVMAGVATMRGQKIHNQLAAVAHTSAEDEVIVFMDADAHPGPRWLRALVKPLVQQEEVGATTGFRYYIPGKPSLPNAMLSVINAAVAALLGPGWRNIAWGGSMAVTRANFFAFGIDAAWQNALSDDYVLSWCVKNRSKRKIQFVQTCLVASSADFSWPQFWEFAARQYRITKICAPGVWLAAIGAALLYLAALAYTISFFLLSLGGIAATDSRTGSVDWLLLVMFIALYTANFLRGRFLLSGGLAAFPEQVHKLRSISFWFTWAYPFSLFINLLALLKSAPGKVITWRGIRYRMHNRLRTDILARQP
jgi:cellulose synthase/poly-beta-1,6-N-acetylglucosamine synthase-like glycosyltransferase